MESMTIKDIARMCGVGVSTVSRAINNHPDINPETKSMIMAMIKEHNYVPNNSARNLKRVDAKVIAVLIKGITNPFFTSVMKGLEKEIQKKKYSLVLHQVDDTENEVAVAMELVKEKRLRGIVFLGGYFSHTEDELSQLPVPFVLCTIDVIGKVKKNTYSSVTVDDFTESCRMVSYLCELGHKEIAIITTGDNDRSIGRLRLDGYKKALSDHGITFNKQLVIPMDDSAPQYSMRCGYNVMKKFLTSGKRCSAVFAISDELAVGASRAILESGYHIPTDISVAGFDGIEMGQFYSPSITTIRQPVEDIARASIEILFDAIKKKEAHQHITFPAELVLGESTDQPKEQK